MGRDVEGTYTYLWPIHVDVSIVLSNFALIKKKRERALPSDHFFPSLVQPESNFKWDQEMSFCVLVTMVGAQPHSSPWKPHFSSFLKSPCIVHQGHGIISPLVGAGRRQ